jgi:hypothetical protein
MANAILVKISQVNSDVFKPASLSLLSFPGLKSSIIFFLNMSLINNNFAITEKDPFYHPNHFPHEPV